MLQAFHNDPAIKEKYVTRMKAHIEADELIQGLGWNPEINKGCAVGCTLENYNHKQYEIELGIPTWLAHIEDRIFEGLAEKDAMKWAPQFLCAINIGADLEKIKPPFLIFILECALEKFNHEKFPDHKKAIINVIELYKNGCIDIDKFRDAAKAAYAAAAYADAAYAADADADAVAVAVAVAVADVRKNEYKKFANKLLELLRECD